MDPRSAKYPASGTLRAFRSLDRALGLLTGSMAVTGTLLIFGIMILVNTDIGLRAAVNAPVIGITEIVSQSIVVIAFLQLPHTLRVGRLTRADLFLSLLTARAPRQARAALSVFDIIGAAVFATLAVASWSPWIEALRQGLYVGAAGGFSFPTWPAKFIVFFGSCVVTVQFTALALGRTTPIAPGERGQA